MKYANLQPAIQAMKSGKNVTATLKEILGSDINSSEIIEIAYDLQAGSYIADVEHRKNEWDKYHNELSLIVHNLLKDLGDQPKILDAGTGEMTTLYRVIEKISNKNTDVDCCDISFSRINVGRKYLLTKRTDPINLSLSPCIANINELPFLNNSFDLVFTSHAIEPNGGKELEMLQELFRVSRNYVLLFEPSYENNSLSGKKRMEALGYAKGIVKAIEKTGGLLIDHFSMKNPIEPLNPTWVYLCQKKESSQIIETKDTNNVAWACPATKLPLKKFEDCFYCDNSRLAYPIIQGIPILRTASAVLASNFP